MPGMSRFIEIITAGLLILGLGIFHHFSTIPGPFHGDEIHYLVMTISLLKKRFNFQRMKVFVQIRTCKH